MVSGYVSCVQLGKDVFVREKKNKYSLYRKKNISQLVIGREVL